MFETIISTTTNPLWTTLLRNTTTLASPTIVLDFNGSDVWNDTSNGGETNNSLLHPCNPENPYFNCSIDEYLTYYLGAKQMPLETAIWVTIFFVGIFVTGVIGNLIVCIVIVKNVSMHTATNYYLFSLAVSDLLFLMMGLPYDLSLYWHQYPYNLGLTFCKIRALISEASTYVSVLTIVAFSMERFLAICHPLHLYTMSGLQRAVRIIGALWIVSFLSAVPFAVFTKIHYIPYPKTNQEIPDSAFCAMLDNPDKFPLWEVSTAIFFCFPMIIMVILYGRMGLKIRSRTRHTVALGVQQGSMHGESKQAQSRKAIIRMLAAVCIVFFITWAPFHAQRLLYLYGQKIESFKALNQWVFAVSGWLYYVSCTLNPVLYNVMSHRYRLAFRDTLCSKRRGYYSSANGFSRDQSSFRETTIVAAGRDHNLNYEGSQLLRSKSMLSSSQRYSRCKDNGRLNSSIRWKENNNIKRVDSVKSNDSAQTQSSNVSSNVIVVCIGNSFKTKCFTTANTSTVTNTIVTQTAPTSPVCTNLSPSSVSFNHCNNNKITSSTSISPAETTTMMTINSKLNHNIANNCPMNNLLEEDEDVELASGKSDQETDLDKDNSELLQTNGIHLSNELKMNEENARNQSTTTTTKYNNEPQNLLIKCINDLKTETCI